MTFRSVLKLLPVLLLAPVFILSSQTLDAPWPWPINSDFGPRNEGSWFHRGIDYLGPNGATILSIENGNVDRIDYSGGWYIAVDNGAGRRWTYLHIFNDNPNPSAGNWQLLEGARLVHPTTNEAVDSNVIVLWSTPGTVASKILSRHLHRGRWLEIDGNTVIDASGNTVLTRGSVIARESIATVGTSGGVGAHLHLGLNQRADNPLLHLRHPPDDNPVITIEQGLGNVHAAEFDCPVTIRVHLNSTAGLDSDKLEMLVFKEGDASQPVTLSSDATFCYGGRDNEGPSPNAETQRPADQTRVEPIGTTPGSDRFIYIGNLSSLEGQVEAGGNSLAVIATDVNDHAVTVTQGFNVTIYYIVSLKIIDNNMNKLKYHKYWDESQGDYVLAQEEVDGKMVDINYPISGYPKRATAFVEFNTSLRSRDMPRLKMIGQEVELKPTAGAHVYSTDLPFDVTIDTDACPMAIAIKAQGCP